MIKDGGSIKKYDGKLCISCKHGNVHKPRPRMPGKAKMMCDVAERKDVSMFGNCENFEDRRVSDSE